MKKSELIAALVQRHPHLQTADVDVATRHVLAQLTEALARGERIEVRGFGAFVMRFRPPRIGRNPKSGTPVALPARYVPHFKPSIQLRQRVNGIYPGR